ncbi:MAG: Crp/Fnr family transcriptional regulator [Acutalibacteraceae bacterium]|nr:Crp/Fnr family transcriptional regulator [Acutalibacteraceae bacterium]
MDREYFIDQLMNIAKHNGFELDRKIIGEVVSSSVFRIIPKGSILRNIGDENDTVALVLNGICRAYYVDGDGNDITRGFAPASTMCMDEGLFGYSESIATWEALEESILMIFETNRIKELIHHNNQLKDMYITLLENALRYKLYRENGFLVENATQRYISFKRRYPEICRTVKQHYIATYLGVTPESLSRIKKALKES